MCPGSLVLPRERDEMGVAASWGTRVHSWMETGECGPEPIDAVGRAIRARVAASGVNRRNLWPEEGEFEVPLAYNVNTGAALRCDYPRVFPSGGTARTYAANWKNAFDDEWVVGSPDFAMELVGRPWVDDLKTGRYAHWTSHAAQQTFYCLAYSKWRYGEFRDSRSTITHWTKYPMAAAPTRKGVILTVDQLEEFGHKLSALRKSILRCKEAPEKIEAELNLGEHCRFCPSQTHCPAYIGRMGD
jgi:PD-(D/E)XK nuclease superfamily